MAFTKTHAILLALCVVIEVIGFWMLSVAPWNNPISQTYAPILLVFVFFVAIPAAIFFPGRKNRQNKED
jgi:uncharacterized membrane protein YiaA